MVFNVDRAKNQITDDSDNTYTMVPVFEEPSNPVLPEVEHAIMGVRTTSAAVDTIMLGERYFLESLVVNALGVTDASAWTGTCKGLLPLPAQK